MRKKEQEITNRVEIDEIINNALICHLSCADNNLPYIVPLSFGYDGKSVFFHTAREGKKVKILKKNPQVCLGFEHDIKLKTDSDRACRWSFDYKSVIAYGIAEELSAPTEIQEGINQIMIHYSGKEWEIPEKELKSTKLWRVKLEKITGKKSPAN